MEAQGPTLGHYDRTKEVKEFDESKMGAKGLSDSGITSIPRIFVHPPESLSGIKKSSDYARGISIPVIDLSGRNSPVDRRKIVDQVKLAASTWGFFQVVNHGIPIHVMDNTISSVKAFYDLPYETRSKYYRRSSEPRGIKYMCNNDLFHSAGASWRDTLQAWGQETAEDIPEICRREMVAWFSHVKDVNEVLMELLSEGLGLETKKFKDLSFQNAEILAGNCYPYCPEPDRTMGIPSHTDPNILTILMQNQVSGLQVRHNDVWVDVEPLRGSLIVNIGEFLQIVSNDEYKSVQHRVLANSCKETRISVVMFFNVENWKCDGGQYGPLPELISPEKPAIYRNFTAKEFYDSYFTRALGNRTLVDIVKIKT